MKIKSVGYFLTLFALMNTAFANDSVRNNALETERQHVVKQYIQNLERADFEAMANLFTEEGFVISTSRGKVNAHDFFYSFLPNIDSAHTELHQLFLSASDSRRYAARFHFNYTLKDNEEGSGEYIDEFVFANHSAKLLTVYMFENHFPEAAKYIGDDPVE